MGEVNKKSIPVHLWRNTVLEYYYSQCRVIVDVVWSGNLGKCCLVPRLLHSIKIYVTKTRGGAWEWG